MAHYHSIIWFRIIIEFKVSFKMEEMKVVSSLFKVTHNHIHTFKNTIYNLTLKTNLNVAKPVGW